MLLVLVQLLVITSSVLGESLCGGWGSLKPGEKAVIYSPNYPNYYSSNRKCEWVIDIPSAINITINCPKFDVYHSQNCYYDYLKISLDGDTYSTSQKFCGTGILSYTIHTNVFRAMFVSSYYNFLAPNRYHKGFECEISFTYNETVIEATSTISTTFVTSTPVGNCECGIKNTEKIVGGQEASLHEYPWQVMLRTVTGGQFCGGTLISSTCVLTASHCVSDYSSVSFYVSLGDHQKSTSSETNQTVNMEVDKIIVHPSYDSVTFDNDISLLCFDKPIQFTKAISPACLPFGLENKNLSHLTATVTGWGATSEGGSTSETLMELDIPVLTTEECRTYFPKQITNNMFCTYSEGKDSCQGDSGGPLVINNDGRYYLFGIVSWGVGCAQNSKPGVYTKVTKYLPWILENTQDTYCRP